jgi:hypothetical protein
MSCTYTESGTVSFTLTHAKHMAAKVAADLKRMQRLYGAPADLLIADLEAEVIALLQAGYMDVVTYGFRRAGLFIVPTLHYTAKDLAGAASVSDDPGLIQPRADVKGAAFYSYLVYSQKWWGLQQSQRDAWPHPRPGAPQPMIDGYLAPDKIYSAGGKALERGSLRSFR